MYNRRADLVQQGSGGKRRFRLRSPQPSMIGKFQCIRSCSTHRRHRPRCHTHSIECTTIHWEEWYFLFLRWPLYRQNRSCHQLRPSRRRPRFRPIRSFQHSRRSPRFLRFQMIRRYFRKHLEFPTHLGCPKRHLAPSSRRRPRNPRQSSPRIVKATHLERRAS